MGNGIRQLKWRVVGTICVLALAGCSFSCMNKPLAPVAPSWETQMTVPVSIRSYTLADLLAKNSNLIGGKLQVSSPFTFSPTGVQFADTASIGDTSGSGQGHTLVDKKTASDFNSITVHVVADNAIPLQVALKLQFLDGAKLLLFKIPQTGGDSITVPAPAVKGGIVQSPTHAESMIHLADTEIQQFNSVYSLAYFLEISTAGTDVAQFQSTATIKIRIWAEFSFQVSK